ncbi:MAG: hypothetical protein DRQ55_16515 [Planctomycetota bacterium]|nr:MAG: hypothetical protein DRQ55_16515 [Planctomycetota bacterium]RLA43821.1 MAG: hypothetical protein DRQ97_12265 [Gammaproteobacteria bacterium]
MTGLMGGSVFTQEAPIRLVSAANTREHWAASHKRCKRLRGLARSLTVGMPGLESPLVVTLTRIAPRPLDGHDNLRHAFKPVVDGIADRLGVADNDPRVSWHYAQQRRAVKDYAIRIEVALRTEGAA